MYNKKSPLTLNTKNTMLLLLLLLVPFTAIAETLYVSDTLRVGIRTKPNSSVPSIAVVRSGVAVEVLQRKGSYIQVRTKNGIEGWVKGAYFSRNIPAAKKLDNALTKIAALNKEVSSLAKQNKTKATTPDLSDKVNALEPRNQALKTEISSLKSNPIAITKTESQYSISNISKNMLYITLGIILVLFSLGFLFGVSWHKNQIAKRMGGMSI